MEASVDESRGPNGDGSTHSMLPIALFTAVSLPSNVLVMTNEVLQQSPSLYRRVSSVSLCLLTSNRFHCFSSFLGPREGKGATTPNDLTSFLSGHSHTSHVDSF